jgi:hypothetical protein
MVWPPPTGETCSPMRKLGCALRHYSPRNRWERDGASLATDLAHIIDYLFEHAAALPASC